MSSTGGGISEARAMKELDGIPGCGEGAWLASGGKISRALWGVSARWVRVHRGLCGSHDQGG